MSLLGAKQIHSMVSPWGTPPFMGELSASGFSQMHPFSFPGVNVMLPKDHGETQQCCFDLICSFLSMLISSCFSFGSAEDGT
jgi:hypothetical protein